MAAAELVLSYELLWRAALAGSSTVALLTSGSVGNDKFSAAKTQPEPTYRSKREALGPVWQLTHLEKTLTPCQSPQSRVWDAIIRPLHNKKKHMGGPMH